MAQGRVVTHYDNLKVARNAPLEVIRAAYRVLAQQFHPDKFPDRPLAEHRMKVINKAYEVLSDPDKRREHDAWVAEQEATKAVEEARQTSATARQPRAQGQAGTSSASQAKRPEFDDAARFRRDTVSSRTEYDFSSSGYRAGAATRAWFSSLGRFAMRLVVFGGILWLAYVLVIEKPNSAPSSPPIAKAVPAPAVAARPLPPANAPTPTRPTFEAASRCFWVYAPIAQTGRDFLHLELFQFGQERMRWFDSFIKLNKENPDLKRLFESGIQRYKPSASSFQNSLQEALSTNNRQLFASVIDAAVSCDQSLGIPTQFIPRL